MTFVRDWSRSKQSRFLRQCYVGRYGRLHPRICHSGQDSTELLRRVPHQLAKELQYEFSLLTELPISPKLERLVDHSNFSDAIVPL